MFKICNTLPLLLIIIAISGCSNRDQSVTIEDLRHHRFVVTKVNNHDVSFGYDSYIEFGENSTINGRMCNDFSGKYLLNHNQLTSSNLSITAELCDNEQLKQLDAIVVKLLNSRSFITSMQYSDKVLLKLTNNCDTLIFERKDLM